MAEIQDTRPIAELIAAATDPTRENGFGDSLAIAELQRIATREVLDLALGLTKSSEPFMRARGADILGQLGVPRRTFPQECVTAVLDLIRDEADPQVLEFAAIALCHLRDPRGIPALTVLAAHAAWRIREVAAHALGECGRTDPAAVAALIRLTNDPVDLVRDWATFEVGQQGVLDTPEIREALYRRLDDPDESTRYEALRGLARCRDMRIVPFLIEAIAVEARDDKPTDHSAMLAAAQMLGIDDPDAELNADELTAGVRALFGSDR